ncbi:hypothetical protein [Acinetobacter indicus]|uniref:Uncharacterized protein n=1 Tax=Acinetobacter indicus TaxID=756892 RepID=A0AAW8Z6R9_9GAMM|nr:hypothetical protein [Acinetobacter indicus]MDV4312563.1 hypothetical protein [Acinetobacter indicus]MDV4316592.1 hypothetical protein [Acinetobacter indicus]
MSEDSLKSENETWQWRLQYRDTILNSKMSIEQIAQQLNTTIEEICNTRKAVRCRLNTKEMIGIVREINMEKWVLEHTFELTNLKMSKLQERYQLSNTQIRYCRMLLKKLKQKETQSVALI